MGKLLELLEKLVRAIFGPGDEQDAGEPEGHEGIISRTNPMTPYLP